MYGYVDRLSVHLPSCASSTSVHAFFFVLHQVPLLADLFSEVVSTQCLVISNSLPVHGCRFPILRCLQALDDCHGDINNATCALLQCIVCGCDDWQEPSLAGYVFQSTLDIAVLKQRYWVKQCRKIPTQCPPSSNPLLGRRSCSEADVVILQLPLKLRSQVIPHPPVETTADAHRP